MRYLHGVVALALVVGAARSQTLIDLRTQSKSVDFSSANTTKPFKSGTTLPATCAVGEAFFKTNAPAGSNLYVCTALNAWSLQTGLTTLAGDVTGSPAATSVNQIQGRPVSSTAPASGQALVWNSSTSSWTPTTAVGPQGPAGPQGPTGPQGSAGPTGPIARVQNSGTNLPVQPTLNFTGGGCTDDPSNGRTNCTGGAGVSGLTITTNGTPQGREPPWNLISGNA